MPSDVLERDLAGFEQLDQRRTPDPQEIGDLLGGELLVNRRDRDRFALCHRRYDFTQHLEHLAGRTCSSPSSPTNLGGPEGAGIHRTKTTACSLGSTHQACRYRFSIRSPSGSSGSAGGSTANSSRVVIAILLPA
ncbi:MAG: hypothetical protein OXI48_05280 [bacterium]|nr:hypothetical protein [bacterium]